MLAPLDQETCSAFGVEPGWCFGLPHRVRWSEVDAFGHANHAAYLEWFEEARNQYLEAVGLPPLSAATPGPVLVGLEVAYEKPLRYGDVVLVTARTAALRRTSLRMEYAVWREGRVARGTAILVLVVNLTGERQAIPPAVRAAIVAGDGPREE
jgi:YbgC/YbaW family acyl-CoA thioester hydrolase